MGVVRSVAKQGGDAGEEFLNDTTKRVERHLVLAAATFAAGFAARTLIGWMSNEIGQRKLICSIRCRGTLKQIDS